MRTQAHDTPLHVAVTAANVEIVRALLHAGANAQLRDAAGRTAEQLAQLLGRTPLVELIRRVRCVCCCCRPLVLLVFTVHVSQLENKSEQLCAHWLS